MEKKKNTECCKTSFFVSRFPDNVVVSLSIDEGDERDGKFVRNFSSFDRIERNWNVLRDLIECQQCILIRYSSFLNMI